MKPTIIKWGDYYDSHKMSCLFFGYILEKSVQYIIGTHFARSLLNMTVPIDKLLEKYESFSVPISFGSFTMYQINIGNSSFKEIDGNRRLTDSCQSVEKIEGYLYCEIIVISSGKYFMDIKKIKDDKENVDFSRIIADVTKCVNQYSHEPKQSSFQNLPSQKEIEDNQILQEAYYSDMTKFEKLISSGMNINSRNKYGDTILKNNASNRSSTNLENIKKLIQLGADIDMPDNVFNSPLHCLVLINCIEGVQLLLDNNVKVDVHSLCSGYAPFLADCYDTPFINACKHGYLEIAKLLLKNGAKDNLDAILYAMCDEGHAEIVKFLLENNVKINAGLFSTSPLHRACLGGHFDVVDVLLQNDALVDALDKNNNTPLFLMILHYDSTKKNEFVKIGKALLDHGAKFEILDALPVYAKRSQVFTELRQYAEQKKI